MQGLNRITEKKMVKCQMKKMVKKPSQHLHRESTNIHMPIRRHTLIYKSIHSTVRNAQPTFWSHAWCEHKEVQPPEGEDLTTDVLVT